MGGERDDDLAAVFLVTLPKIKLRGQRSAFTRLWLLTLKKDTSMLILACCLVGAVILISAFFFHLYDQNTKDEALQAERTLIAHQVNRGITERLSFLFNVLEGVTDARQIGAVLVSLPDLSPPLLSDTFVVQGKEKYTKRGPTPFLTGEALDQKKGVFRDKVGYLCFVKKGSESFYVVRLSLTSFASALKIPASSLSLSFARPPPTQRAVPLAQEGWLVFKEDKPSLAALFIAHYFWLILSVPLISLFLLGAFLTLYGYIFFSLKKAHRLDRTDLEKDLKSLKDQNLILTADTQKKVKMAAALRKKQKIQAELFQELSGRRQKLLEKTSDFARLVSHSFAEEKKLLEDQEVFKLLLEISHAATLLSEGLFEPSIAQPLSLAEETQKIATYLDWILLKSEVSLKIEIDEECILEVEQMGFTLLFINLLVRHIERAHEKAQVLFCVTQREDRIEFHISCEDSFSSSTPLGNDSAANPLILTDEALAKLAKILGFSSFAPDVKKTTLVYTPQKPRQILEGGNIVALFQ